MSYNDGKPSGTICYIKNIGKFFPIFKSIYSDNYYDLNEYINKKDWLTILPEIGLEIKKVGFEWQGGGEYHFYKKSPIIKDTELEDIFSRYKKPTRRSSIINKNEDEKY